MSDKTMIESGEWVPCRICEEMFARKRETRRYCAHCENAACEGEHGGFDGAGFVCVVCAAKETYKTSSRAGLLAV